MNKVKKLFIYYYKSKTYIKVEKLNLQLRWNLFTFTYQFYGSMKEKYREHFS